MGQPNREQASAQESLLREVLGFAIVTQHRARETIDQLVVPQDREPEPTGR
jgi:hypothetical protein